MTVDEFWKVFNNAWPYYTGEPGGEMKSTLWYDTDPQYKILPRYAKNIIGKDYKMHHDSIKIKIGDKFYCPDIVSWNPTSDAFPELEISTRISPSNLDTEFNLSITNVIFNPPATIIFWSDKTKTVVKCDPKEAYDPEKGLAMAICKKMIGNNKRDYYNVFLHWIKKFKKQVKEEYDSWAWVRRIFGDPEDDINGTLDNGGDLEDD